MMLVVWIIIASLLLIRTAVKHRAAGASAADPAPLLAPLNPPSAACFSAAQQLEWEAGIQWGDEAGGHSSMEGFAPSEEEDAAEEKSGTPGVQSG